MTKAGPSSPSNSSSEWSHVGLHQIFIPPASTFDPQHPQIKHDIIRMIVQYLQTEGYAMSATTLQDETNIKMRNELHHREAIKRLCKAITEGEWDTVAKLVAKYLVKRQNQQGFVYAICKQEYLELIDRQEYQKAFTYLTTQLKPLKKLSKAAGGKDEFHDLCYLLTCKSVHEAESFKDWPGVEESREQLVEQLQATFDFESANLLQLAQMPEDRLVTLLHQATAYQMEFSRYHPRTTPKVHSLLQDFECTIVPNAVKSTFYGHSDSVKCVTFVGEKGEILASGGSDNTIKLWSVESSAVPGIEGDSPAQSTSSDPTLKKEEGRQFINELHGHNAKIWDVCSSRCGKYLFSASGDASIKIWDLTATSAAHACHSTMLGHTHDVYSVYLHPKESHIVSAGYDRNVRLFDLATGKVVKTFTGHSASVCDARFNPHGNLIVSGSKDGTIRFWDIVSGLCVRTLRQTLGEVTSVQLTSSGLYLLSGSKNNSNRLWDVRMGSGNADSSSEDKPLQRFKGHQNTAKNFIRAAFGPRESLVLGGSEDGLVHVWDVATGNLLERLSGHSGVVYTAKWHERQALMATCSHDNTIKTWWWDDRRS